MKRAIPFAILSLAALCTPSRAQTSAPSSAKSQTRANRSAEQRFFVDRGPAHIEVIAQGTGPLLVILPSLGRGVGRSTGPMSGQTFMANAIAVFARSLP